MSRKFVTPNQQDKYKAIKYISDTDVSFMLKVQVTWSAEQTLQYQSPSGTDFKGGLRHSRWNTAGQVSQQIKSPRLQNENDQITSSNLIFKQ